MFSLKRNGTHFFGAEQTLSELKILESALRPHKRIDGENSGTGGGCCVTMREPHGPRMFLPEDKENGQRSLPTNYYNHVLRNDHNLKKILITTIVLYKALPQKKLCKVWKEVVTLLSSHNI